MERIPAKTQGPVVLTYDGPADLAFEKRVQVINTISLGVHETEEILREIEGLFKPIMPLAEQITASFRVVSRAVERINKTAILAQPESIKPFELKGSNRFSTKREDNPEPRKIVLTENFPLSQLERNFIPAQHDFRTPLTSLQGFAELGLGRPSANPSLSWDKVRNAFYRTQGTVGGWEEELLGEFPKTEIPVIRLAEVATTILRDTLTLWLHDEKGMGLEDAAERATEILQIGEIPEDQKEWKVYESLKRFKKLNENIASNLIDQMKKNNEIDPQIKVELGGNPQSQYWEEAVHTNFGRWDPRMNFKFSPHQSFSGRVGAQGVGMAAVVRGMDYILRDRDNDKGTTQIYKYKVRKT